MRIANHLIRDKKFHNWYLEKMVGWMTKAKGIGREQCQAELADSFIQEMNSLHFVLENFYPGSRPTNDKFQYVFVTDPIEHDLFNANGVVKKFFPGRLFLTFDEPEPRMEFPDEPTFIHGHIRKSNKQIRCYGGYNRPYTTAANAGFAGLLAEMYNFACKAGYGSTINGEPSLIQHYHAD